MIRSTDRKYTRANC